MIKMGQKVRDKITGFEGIVIAKVEYLTRCVQYCVKPRIVEPGKMPEGCYIDEVQLEVVDEGKPEITPPPDDGIKIEKKAGSGDWRSN